MPFEENGAGRKGRVVSVRGNRRWVQELIEEFGIQTHITTPGHARSHGAIERVHGTIAEHLSLLEIGREIKGVEAISRAVIAYNHSIHSSTGRTPLELMREFHREEREVPIGQELEGLKVREERAKESRNTKINEKRRNKAPGRLGIGQKVYIKNLVKRRKDDPRYVGPYIIRELLTRNRIKLTRVGETSGRFKIRHINEVKTRGRR
jgi:hypothetical protein